MEYAENSRFSLRHNSISSRKNLLPPAFHALFPVVES